MCSSCSAGTGTRTRICWLSHGMPNISAEAALNPSLRFLIVDISIALSLHVSVSVFHIHQTQTLSAACISFTMKFFLFLPFLVWNTSLAVALPASDGYVPSGAQCQDYAIPVTVTSSNYPWTAAKWTDNYGLIDYVSTATSRTDAGFPPPFGNPVNQTATYTIGATFCTPTNPATNSDKVLLATHGLAFDRR